MLRPCPHGLHHRYVVAIHDAIMMRRKLPPLSLLSSSLFLSSYLPFSFPLLLSTIPPFLPLPLSAVLWHAAGSMLITTSRDKTAKLWQLKMAGGDSGGASESPTMAMLECQRIFYGTAPRTHGALCPLNPNLLIQVTEVKTKAWFGSGLPNSMIEVRCCCGLLLGWH